MAILLVTTMFLSDVVNDAAAAVLMAPIRIDLAAALDASADPFLMAVINVVAIPRIVWPP